MKKRLIVLLVFILTVFLFTGCENNEKQELKATLYDYSVSGQWQLSAEEAEALSEYFEKLPLVEENIKEIYCPYKIVFDNGNTYYTDGKYLEWTDGKNSGAVELKEKNNGLQVLLVDYIVFPETEQEFSLYADTVIVYNKEQSGWNKTVLRYGNAKTVCDILASEDIVNVGVPGDEIVLYADFGNGTVLEVFKNEIANIYINADSAVLELDILSGDNPVTKLKQVENRVKLPQYTLSVIMRTVNNSEETE